MNWFKQVIARMLSVFQLGFFGFAFYKLVRMFVTGSWWGKFLSVIMIIAGILFLNEVSKLSPKVKVKAQKEIKLMKVE